MSENTIPPQVTSEEINRVNQELYKRNVELAFRNKTLALLRQMYATTLMSLPMQPLAQQLADTLRGELKLGMTAIYVVEKENLKPLVFSRSQEVETIAGKYNHPLHDAIVPLSNTASALVQALQTQQRQEVTGFQGLWAQDIPMLAELQNEAKITNTLIFPLVASNEAFGVLLLSLYKSFAEYTYFEMEAIEAVVRVVAVALDKAKAHEELANANIQLAKDYESLQKLYKMRSEFLDTTSHQLRTPVSVIRGTLSMMQEGDMKQLPEEKQKQFIDNAVEKGTKLEQIISDILAASELDSKKFTIDAETPKAQLEDIVDQIVHSSKFDAEQRGTELQWEKPASSLSPIIGHKQFLEQAIANYINNAIKYTPSLIQVVEARDKRDTKGVIKVAIKQDKNNIVVSVSDNGIGVPKDEVSKLFVKFARASNATAMYTDGTGLGLFIVKEIIEGHRGKVWVESELGKGSTFYFSLPVAVK